MSEHAGGEAGAMGGTGYLAPERTPAAGLAAEIARAAGSPLVTALLEGSGTAAAVLDPQRQIVAVNDTYLRLVGVEDPAAVLGLRPGEALACANVPEGGGGCGTGPACPSCGAAIAVLIASHRGHVAERTCALVRGADGARSELMLQVRAAPVALEGDTWVLLTLRDATEAHRREGVARAFLHDLANVATGLQSATEAMEGPASNPTAAADARALAALLVREVALQRLLLAGRGGTEPLQRRPVQVGALLGLLLRALERHPASAGRKVQVAVPHLLELRTDATALHHVLLNMTLNALEATRPGGAIRLEVLEEASAVRFRTWNGGAIPAAVRPRIFQRHFSTKREPGRGHGTYAMRLFGEQLLGGQVGFTSTSEDGTWFELVLPHAP
ncbi:MAG: sensor histidine kinase [Anaeromyxobacter sp.]